PALAGRSLSDLGRVATELPDRPHRAVPRRLSADPLRGRARHRQRQHALLVPPRHRARGAARADAVAADHLRPAAPQALQAAAAAGVHRELRRAIRHLFLFIGAEPYTEWLSRSGVTLDDKGFVRTDANP